MLPPITMSKSSPSMVKAAMSTFMLLTLPLSPLIRDLSFEHEVDPGDTAMELNKKALHLLSPPSLPPLKYFTEDPTTLLHMVHAAKHGQVNLSDSNITNVLSVQKSMKTHTKISALHPLPFQI